jgi:hypothetical protein
VTNGKHHLKCCRSAKMDIRIDVNYLVILVPEAARVEGVQFLNHLFISD